MLIEIKERSDATTDIDEYLVDFKSIITVDSRNKIISRYKKQMPRELIEKYLQGGKRLNITINSEARRKTNSQIKENKVC